MGIQHTQKFCDRCEDYVLAVRKGPNHILHLILSIITGGLWIIIWILVSLKIGGWRCPNCGSAVYKAFTTKEVSRPQKGEKLAISEDRGGRYSIGFPIVLFVIGAFALLMSIVRKEIAPFLFAGGCIGVGYMLWIGREK